MVTGYTVTIIAQKYISELSKSVPVEIKFTYPNWADAEALIDSLVDGTRDLTIEIEKEVK